MTEQRWAESALENHLDFSLDSFERIVLALRQRLKRAEDPNVRAALEEAERAAGVLRYSREEVRPGAIGDRKIRALPAEMREELFSYVPRHRLVGMSRQALRAILGTYDREDLFRSVEKELR